MYASELIGSEGCEYLTEALKTNTTLKKLILSSNGIDDYGIKALAEAIVVNKTLAALVCLAQGCCVNLYVESVSFLLL